MKTVYRCDICCSDYDTIAKAVACESQVPPACPPQGLILTVMSNFAALCTGTNEELNHHRWPLAYWFRDNGCGDDENPRNDAVGSSDWSTLKNTEVKSGTFYRALSKCQSLGWIPTILVDGEIVTMLDPKGFTMSQKTTVRRTPWEIAESWYSEAAIRESILQSGVGGSGSWSKIPTDVYSPEFAKWLTEQYRLAMAKGIQLGRDGSEDGI